MNPRERRCRRHGNSNIEEFLERICTAIEVKSGSTVKSEVEECINILNQMEEISRGNELYLFLLNLFARQDKRLIFYTIKEADLRLQCLEKEKQVELFRNVINALFM